MKKPTDKQRRDRVMDTVIDLIDDYVGWANWNSKADRLCPNFDAQNASYKKLLRYIRRNLK